MAIRARMRRQDGIAGVEEALGRSSKMGGLVGRRGGSPRVARYVSPSFFSPQSIW